MSRKHHGHLDAFDGTIVSGWAYAEGMGYCTVDIFLDGRLVGRALADQYRADLKHANIGNGCCAFHFQIPEHALTGYPQTLSARHAGANQELIGSPIRVIGPPATVPPPAITSQLIRNAAFSNIINAAGPVTLGINKIAPGIWLEASRNAIGSATFTCSHFDGFQFSRLGNITPGIRVQAPIDGAHIRLFMELNLPDFVVLGPLTATFAIDRRGTDAPPEVKLGFGTVADGKFCGVWSRTIKRVIAGIQEHSFLIEPYVLQKLKEDYSAKRKPVTIFDIKGRFDIALSALHLLIGRTYSSHRDSIVAAFEDSIVAEQWEAIGTPKINNCTPPRDTAWAIDTVLDVPEIVVPVFNATKSVLDCLLSIFSKTDIPYLLTVVDDGSFPETSAAIHKAIGNSPWCRIITGQNEGYTVAINKAVKSSVGSTIVILNSDTVVTSGWLTGLLRCLRSDSKVGLAGPLSNAASWQSIPEVKDKMGWAVNRLPADASPDNMAEHLRLVSKPAYPEVPVLNGFCLAVKREVFDVIGVFDELAFPMGYGEENDFCLRAADAGYTLRVADDVYVYHHKSKSFGAKRRSSLSDRANKVLTHRYGAARMNGLSKQMEKCGPLNDLRHTVQAAMERAGHRGEE